MKFIFREIGPAKFSKIVEVTGFPQNQGVLEFLTSEAQPYMPKEGSVELIPQDGLPEFASGQFAVVHCDRRFLYTGMGSVIVYR